MRTRPALFLKVPVLLGMALTVVVALGAPASAARTGPAVAAAPIAAAKTAIAVTPSLNATIRLSNCSASLVRYPTSVSTDRAMMLTNGHCYEGGFLSAGQVLLDQPSSRTGSLRNSSGTIVATVTAERIIYATMTKTDVLLYRLNQSIATIQANTGITPLTISASHPASGISMFIPSGYHAQIWNCSINGFAATVRESQWTWNDSIRYSMPCQIIPGTSGSPVVSTSSGEVVGANNTINENGQMCTLNNPCEVLPNGDTIATINQGYGQQTYWFNTCLTAARTIDLGIPGCLLFGATGGGTTIYSDTFETATGWTLNPLGSDTATVGQWERGDPAQTSSNGVKQLGTTVSGVNDLVTGRLAGSSAGTYDIDSGVTTIQSPLITLPSSGALTLTFSYYLAHGSNSSNADFFRAFVVAATTSQVFQSLGAATNRNGVWTGSGNISLTGYAGQQIRIRFQAADASTASLVEAGVDNVTILQQ